jgi:hypothetical protein
MKPMGVFGAAVVVLMVGGGLGTARAQGLPAASGIIQCVESSGSGYIMSTTSCSGGTDTGLVTYSPVASVQTYAFGEGLVEDSGAYGVLNYSFEVVGGAPGTVVPVDVATNLRAIPISIGYVFSELDLFADGTTEETICSSFCGANTGVESFSGVLQVDAVSGQIYINGVHLEAEAGGSLGGTGDFDGGTATVDPYLYVDPSFPNASEYSILVSPGIGNAPPGGIPEPASWALMLLGMAGIGGVLRVRGPLTSTIPAVDARC